MDKSDFGGWATTLDGERVRLTAGEAEAIWASCKAVDAKRRETMPDSMSALSILHDALTRLRDEGWREGIYCPKDGSEFALIEIGSTGIFSGFYEGEWPKGSVCYGDGFSHPKGLLWKPLNKLSDAERARFEKCAADERRMMEADARRYQAMTADNAR